MSLLLLTQLNINYYGLAGDAYYDNGLVISFKPAMTNGIEADSAYGQSDDQLKKWNRIESDACVDGHPSAQHAVSQV